MNKEEIAELAQAIQQRKLVGKLKQLAVIERPTISNDTIYRALRSETYFGAPEAVKLVLRVAKEVKAKDDERIKAKREQVLELATTEE